MRILYDGAVYSAQAAGGITRYFAELISRLPLDDTPVLLSAKKREFPAHRNLELHCREFGWWPKPLAKLNRIREQRHFQHLHNSLRADLSHPTYYQLLSKRRATTRRFPTVLTVYDLIHERYPQALDPQGRHAELKRSAISRADAIICISEHTKRDLLEFYGVPESKVSVIHLATGIADVAASARLPSVRRPYFLYVGSRASYKNFDRLLEALGSIVARHPDASLQVVGEAFAPAELLRIDSLGLANRVVHAGSVGDAALKRLYQESEALVYPSQYEGFGIPPLEAMACGTAVVAANTSSIPEVVGDAGLLFPPESTGDLADILESLLAKPSLRQRLISKGLQQATKFSWDRTVADHLTVYRRAAHTFASRAA